MASSTGAVLPLRLREFNWCGRSGIHTVGELAVVMASERLPAGIGDVGREQIEVALAEYWQREGASPDGGLVVRTLVEERLSVRAPQIRTPAARTEGSVAKRNEVNTMSAQKKSTPNTPAGPRRWTTEDEAELLAATTAADPASRFRVFERVAEDRGISAATVQAKYYALARAAKGVPASKRSKGSKKGKRWTKALEARLVREVSGSSGDARAGVYAAWAAKRGVSVSAIQAKFYDAKKRHPASARASASPSTNAGVATVDRTSTNDNNGPVDLGTWTMLELAVLGRRVAEEVERRVTTVHQAWT